ncbi:hypothetical protein AS850_12100 [Frondihabitans sp. 762G35]|uniref:hypothetical protein n=1 Tax=Frondihabitans sp. 762G35 TaxID=1446794 RepID=UPI000D205D10|nr:hypothetical protein [Frondihabitans sp. 762G35]ARC57816.1 hypothetical protein AS850_12100 [Frondihabitans sp. 762G35]
MRPRRMLAYLLLVGAAVALTADGIRRLVVADYLGWTIEIVAAVALGVLAYRVRRGRDDRSEA